MPLLESFDTPAPVPLVAAVTDNIAIAASNWLSLSSGPDRLVIQCKFDLRPAQVPKWAGRVGGRYASIGG